MRKLNELKKAHAELHRESEDRHAKLALVAQVRFVRFVRFDRLCKTSCLR